MSGVLLATACGQGAEGDASLAGEAELGEADQAVGEQAVVTGEGAALVPSSCIKTSRPWWDTHSKTVNVRVTNNNCRDAQGRNLILKARVIWRFWKDGACRNIYPGASSTWSAPAPPAEFDRVEQCN